MSSPGLRIAVAHSWNGMPEVQSVHGSHPTLPTAFTWRGAADHMCRVESHQKATAGDAHLGRSTLLSLSSLAKKRRRASRERLRRPTLALAVALKPSAPPQQRGH